MQLANMAIPVFTLGLNNRLSGVYLESQSESCAGPGVLETLQQVMSAKLAKPRATIAALFVMLKIYLEFPINTSRFTSYYILEFDLGILDTREN